VSLRARLVVGLLAMAAVGLLLANLAVYASMRSFLSARVDQQIEAARQPATRALFEGRPDRPGIRRAPRPSTYPAGTWAAILDNGAVVAETWLGEAPSFQRPRLPDYLDPVTETDTHRFSTEFLPGTAAAFVVAVPLTEMKQTLARLLWIMALVGVSVLTALAALATWVVRVGLAPLERMAQTASEIAAGDLSARVGTTDPRTEVGRLGVALNAMLAQIERAFAERTESEARLRRFLADASHELRTPLTSIRGYAELFRRGARARPDDLANAMARIEDEAARMGVLVEDLLVLARLDQGRPLEREPVDLAALAADAVTDARASDPDRPIGLRTSGPVPVLGDGIRLRQVLANLLSNALAHTPDGTPVDVDVSRTGQHAVLRVVDHGPGVPKGDERRVFERFYRADPSRTRDTGGAGLGLSIVDAIVRAHDGSVHVEGTVGGGATFVVRLPILSDLSGGAHGEPSPARSDVPGTTRDPQERGGVS